MRPRPEELITLRDGMVDAESIDSIVDWVRSIDRVVIERTDAVGRRVVVEKIFPNSCDARRRDLIAGKSSAAAHAIHGSLRGRIEDLAAVNGCPIARICGKNSSG